MPQAAACIIGLECQQIAGVLIKSIRNHVAGSLEADELFLDCTAATTAKLNMGKPQATQVTIEAEIPKRDVRMTVDVHPLSAYAPSFAFRKVKIPLKAVNCSAGCCFPDDGVSVMEPKQAGWNFEKFC